MRPRTVAARPTLLSDRREGHLVRSPECWPYKSVHALAAWARAGCPEDFESGAPTLSFDSLEQLRIFALSEGWSDRYVDLTLRQLRAIRPIPTSHDPPVLGVAPDGDAQIQGAINFKQYLQSSNWIPQPNIPNLIVQGCGAGGGGGGGGRMKNSYASTPNNWAGGGGGAGAIFGSVILLAATYGVGAKVPVKPAVASLGGSGSTEHGAVAGSQGSDGGAGGNSVFGGWVSFAGGSPGCGGFDVTVSVAGLNNTPGSGGCNCTSNGADAFAASQAAFTVDLVNAGAGGGHLASGGCGYGYQGVVAGALSGAGGDSFGFGAFIGGLGGAAGTKTTNDGGGGGGGGGAGPNGSGGVGGSGGNGSAGIATSGSNGTSGQANTGAGGGGGGTGGSGSSALNSGKGGNGGNGGSGLIVVIW